MRERERERERDGETEREKESERGTERERENERQIISMTNRVNRTLCTHSYARGQGRQAGHCSLQCVCPTMLHSCMSSSGSEKKRARWKIIITKQSKKEREKNCFSFLSDVIAFPFSSLTYHNCCWISCH